MMNALININNRLIGVGHEPYIIAEAGLNHGGDIDLATKMIQAAAEAGLDSIKFQAFNAEQRFGNDRDTIDLVKPAELNRNDFITLKQACDDAGITFFSTAFDEASVDMLIEIGSAAIKIASCDICNLKLLKAAALSGLPIVISRGTANESEIDQAMDVLLSNKAEVLLLHCISSYPMADGDANLAAIARLKSRYSVPIGYSDHSKGTQIPLFAVYAGAQALEVHFTFDRGLQGIDWEISAEPQEMSELKKATQRAHAILGNGLLQPMESEKEEIDYRNSLRLSS